MKILLLKDHPKLGKKGDIVEVSDGYARNYLIPKGIGKEAKEGDIKHFKDKQKNIKDKQERIKRKSERILKELQSRVLIVKAKAGTEGRLFGAITSADISKIIEKEYKISFDKRWFADKVNIKNLGTHRVTVKLPGGVKGEIIIKVEKE